MSGELWIFAAFFALVAGGVIAAGYYLVLRPEVARGAAPQALPAPRPAESAKETAAKVLESLGRTLPIAPSDVEAVRKELIAAGYRWPSAVPIYYGIKISISITGAMILAWLAWIGNGLFAAFVAAVAAGGFSYKVLDRVLFAIIRARSGRIRRSLPSALDLMVLGIEAGQSLDYAIQNTARELQFVYPELCDEMALTFFELQLGKSRAEAFRAMAERSNEPELRKLAKLFIDTDRFGTSLGPVLRSHAKYLRIRMRQQAQEQARKIGVKLVFPIFFLIFPSVLVVTLGPAVITLMDQLRNMMGQ